MRLIDADELINKLNKFESDVYGSAECYSSVTEITEAIEYVGILIDEIPTVEAVPVVHGEWIDTQPDYHNGFYRNAHVCSNCNDYYTTEYDDLFFCPRCGADMRTSAE